jgi:alkylated DNA repair protein (DNA oxidative demethylase)
MPNGSLMSVRTVCLGWDWVPYRYSRRTADGESVKPFPEWLGDWGRQALAGLFQVDYRPDVALVNLYLSGAKMGLHQDREEHSSAPVVSFSVGDSCLFRLGNTRTRAGPWSDVLLNSGDLFVFGAPARMAFHGVLKTLPGTGPGDIGLTEGRLNVTLRESGLT